MDFLRSKSKENSNGEKSSNNLEEMAWSEVKTSNTSETPSSRNCHSAVKFNNYMIIFGGKEGEGKRRFVNDIHVLDFELMMWLEDVNIQGAPPESRMGHSASIYNEENVIIFGGWNGQRVLEDTFKLIIDNTESKNILKYN